MRTATRKAPLESWIPRAAPRHNFPPELTPKERRIVEEITQPVHVHEGEYLFHEGEKLGCMFLIDQGEVEMGRVINPCTWVDMGPYGPIDVEGEEEEAWESVLTLGPWDVVGEFCMMEREPHTLTALVKNEGNLLVLDEDQFSWLDKRQPTLAHHLKAALKRKMV